MYGKTDSNEIVLGVGCVESLMVTLGERKPGAGDESMDFGIAKIDFRVPPDLINLRGKPVSVTFTIWFEYWPPVLKVAEVPENALGAAADAAMAEALRGYQATVGRQAGVEGRAVFGVGTMKTDGDILKTLFSAVKRLGACYGLLADYAAALAFCPQADDKPAEFMVREAASVLGAPEHEERIAAETERRMRVAIEKALDDAHGGLEAASAKLGLVKEHLEFVVEELQIRDGG